MATGRQALTAIHNLRITAQVLRDSRDVPNMVPGWACRVCKRALRMERAKHRLRARLHNATLGPATGFVSLSARCSINEEARRA